MDTTNEVGRLGSRDCSCVAAEGRERPAAATCECGPACPCGLCGCEK